MKNFKKLLSVVAVFAIAMTAFAQEEAKEGAGDGMPAMGPPKEIKEMAHLVGTWNADFLMRMSPDAEWANSPCTQVISGILGGCGYRADFSTTVMGMPFNGLMTVTYNRNTNNWQSTWVDNLGAYQSMLEGDFVDGVMTLNGAALEMGQAYLMKDITHHKSDTELEWQMDVSFDNGETWFTQMKATYTKAK